MPFPSAGNPWIQDHENDADSNMRQFSPRGIYGYIPDTPLITWLYYFDIKAQKIQFCKSFISQMRDQITAYTLSEHMMQNYWNDATHYIIQEMKQLNDTQDIFKFYHACFSGHKSNALSCKALKADSYTWINHWGRNNPFQVIVFQLNHAHEYFSKHGNYLIEIEKYYHDVLQRECHCDVKHLISDEWYPITMRYSLNNTLSISECLNYHLSQQDLDNVSEQDLVVKSMIIHKVTPHTKALLLYEKIEKELNYVVP
eukprot:169337_1